MKRIFALLAVGAFVLALPASHLVFGKAHVRLGKVQVCHKGKVLQVSKNALKAHVKHGDCQLPACDAANVSFRGDDCTTAGAIDDKCDLANLPDPIVTDVCPPGTF